MDNEEAWYEPEGIGCRCTEDGVDSVWVWDPNSGCYVCTGCNEVQ